MGLLSKLFCKEEPPTASSVPAPTASTDEPYIPFVERRFVTVTCVGCGALRSTLDELQERRDAQVGWRYREAAKLSVPWPCPEFPAGARMTARLKKAFGL